MLEQLAKEYAERLGTSVLASRVDGKRIIFVLASGPKLSMTAEELTASAPSAAGTPPPDEPAQSAEEKPKAKKARKNG